MSDADEIRITMSQLDKDFEYYLDLVEKENKKVIVTREGRDFVALVPTDFYSNDKANPTTEQVNGR